MTSSLQICPFMAWWSDAVFRPESETTDLVLPSFSPVLIP